MDPETAGADPHPARRGILRHVVRALSWREPGGGSPGHPLPRGPAHVVSGLRCEFRPVFARVDSRRGTCPDGRFPGCPPHRSGERHTGMEEEPDVRRLPGCGRFGRFAPTVTVGVEPVVEDARLATLLAVARGGAPL